MYNINDLCGWIPPSQRDKQLQKKIEEQIEKQPKFLIKGKTPSTRKRLCSFEIEKRVDAQQFSPAGEWFPTTRQNIGSCVGHGIFNVLWRMQALEIVEQGEREKMTMPYLPYNYAISRIEVGRDRYGYNFGNDPSGSLGALAAEGARDFGVLRFDFDKNLSMPVLERGRYGTKTLNWSGRTDAQWAVKGVPDKYEVEGKQHLVKTVSQVKGWDQIREALLNGYWITAAWMFNVSDKTEEFEGKTWAYKSRVVGGHQVCLTGIDISGRREGAFLLNSWGADFYGRQSDGPAGGVWVPYDFLDRESRSSNAEFFAFSRFNGYPVNRLTWLMI